MSFKKISTIEMLGKLFMEECTKEDKINWATSLISEGKNGKNLLILAGLSANENYFELEQYFQKSLKENNLNNLDKKKCLQDYAIFLAKLILEGNKSYKSICHILYEIWISTDYDNKYEIWLHVYDLIYAIETDCYSHVYGKVSKDNP